MIAKVSLDLPEALVLILILAVLGGGSFLHPLQVLRKYPKNGAVVVKKFRPRSFNLTRVPTGGGGGYPPPKVLGDNGEKTRRAPPSNLA